MDKADILLTSFPQIINKQIINKVLSYASHSDVAVLRTMADTATGSNASGYSFDLLA